MSSIWPAVKAVLPDTPFRRNLCLKFPSVSRDMTFIMDKGVEVGQVLEEIGAFAKKAGTD